MQPIAQAALAVILVACAASLMGQASEGESFLEMGIRQVEGGDFEAAVFSLDKAVQKLGERTAKLARAYVYLGAAYVGLDHEDAAKGKFRQALGLDAELQLSREEFSSRVIRLFESQRLVKRAASTRRGAKIALILGGVGAAAAVGISAATSESGLPDNRPPAASLGIEPAEWQALVAVTELTFTASASDPDGDSLSYGWDFGDGGGASGRTATHVYQTEGDFDVQLTVDDGRGQSTTTSQTVEARLLTGTWDHVSFGSGREFHSCVQSGAQLACERVSNNPEDRFRRWRATLSHPRQLSAVLETANPGAYDGTCDGEVNDLVIPGHSLNGMYLESCPGEDMYRFHRVQ